MNNTIIELLKKDVPLVLATVVASSGSAPRKAGARMLVSPEGLVRGTIGGGAVEAQVLEAAREILQSRIPAFGHFELKAGEGQTESICGGAQDIFIEPLPKESLEQFERAAEAKSGFWRLDISNPTDPQRVFCLDKESLVPDMDLSAALIPGVVRYEIAENGQPVPGIDRLEFTRGMAAGQDTALRGGRVFYLEHAASEHTVLLCGGGHIAKALADLLSKLDFELEVVENREEMAAKERFPSARAVHHLPEFAGLNEICHIGSNHYIVIVTHGHQHDFTVLEQALHTSARYIGMIGSKSKRDAIYSTLNERGVPKAELACVCCPIGLDIGGQTPEEIGISIAAELIAARNSKLHVKRRG